MEFVSALHKATVIDGKATSKKARRAVQDAFNTWSAETGRPLCQLSKILACSVAE